MDPPEALSSGLDGKGGADSSGDRPSGLGGKLKALPGDDFSFSLDGRLEGESEGGSSCGLAGELEIDLRGELSSELDDKLRGNSTGELSSGLDGELEDDAEEESSSYCCRCCPSRKGVSEKDKLDIGRRVQFIESTSTPPVESSL